MMCVRERKKQERKNVAMYRFSHFDGFLPKLRLIVVAEETVSAKV